MKNGGSMQVPVGGSMPVPVEMVTRIVTMIGGVDVIGDITESAKDTGWERLWRPFQLMPNQQGLQLRPMLGAHGDKRFIICGDYLVINMRNVLWVNEPGDYLLKSYLAARSGVMIPSASEMVGMNQ